MSNLFIILLLLLPIVIVVIFLGRSQKRHKKRRTEGYLKYLNQIKDETGITAGYQKQLTNQLVVLDEIQKKLLVIDNQNEQYNYTLFNLIELKSCSIKHISTTITPTGKGQKPETYTTQTGLEIATAGKNQLSKLIVFFDHIEHNIMLKAEKEKEALDLQEKITRLAKKQNQL